MSTETSKAAFIDPTAIAAASSDDSKAHVVAPAGDSVFPSAAEVIENITEGSVATTTATTSSAISEVAAQNAEAIGQVAMKYGDLKAMGLVHFTPVGGLETVLEAIHISTGLPWWGTIVATTIIIRTALVPFIVKLQGNTARLHNVKPQLERLTENMKLAKESNDTAALARFSAQTQELFAKNDCNPLKSLMLPLIQAPVMISFYLALRDMAYLPVPQFKEGGTLWFTDLTIADPTYALPVASSLGFLAIMELGSEAGGVAQPKNIKNFMRFMAVAMVPLTMNFPSAIFVYWLTSNIFTAGQIMFFKVPAVRQLFNIPQLINHPKPKVTGKQPGFMESFKASYEGGLAAKQKEVTLVKERENKLAAQKLRRQNRKRI
ncbi:60Kd inner membrane protein-domain-containing protein [Gamsiella multidivaricata]|uniref:60Kd inner membrane protein-domain-containing protein n=1 Tax=Gamsiella multidivaricata TaxID=101098 RepID=UPI0022212294|nr:60Kd inner membrane protein-domain-containing protein [Gamsiella multidivaricata]KAI7819172.1 60Kd inner membrane protein-domain-containing protein [Gamsiella multidivaricata]